MEALPEETTDEQMPLGQGMGAPNQRRRRHERAEGSQALSLTPQKVALLCFVAECRFLSLPQLARLTALSEKSTRRHMRQLFDGGLVDKIPVTRASVSVAGSTGAQLLYGSAPDIYAANRLGLELLADAGHFDRAALKRSQPAYGPQNSLFIAHELLVRDVRVWLQGLIDVREERRVLDWWDGNNAVIPVSAKRAVRPDARFVFQLRPAQADAPDRPLVLVGLVEVDRGTERGTTRWHEKLDDYIGLFAHQETLKAATGYTNARVLVVAPDTRRRDTLADLILSRIREVGLVTDILSRFWFAVQGDLPQANLTEPVWRRPGSDTLWPLIAASILTEERH